MFLREPEKDLKESVGLIDGSNSFYFALGPHHSYIDDKSVEFTHLVMDGPRSSEVF